MLCTDLQTINTTYVPSGYESEIQRERLLMIYTEKSW